MVPSRLKTERMREVKMIKFIHKGKSKGRLEVLGEFGEVEGSFMGDSLSVVGLLVGTWKDGVPKSGGGRR